MTRGRPRKAVTERQGRRAPLLALPQQGSVVPVVPAPPPHLLRSSRQLWASLWASPLAQVWDPVTDRMAVEELVRLVDERERAWRAFRRERLVPGSQGQPRLNPLWNLIQDTTAQILQLSDRLGLTPRARLQLGITFSQAAMGIAELNRMLDEVEDDDDGDVALETDNHAIAR